MLSLFSHILMSCYDLLIYYYCSRSRVRSVIYALVYLYKSRNTPCARSTSSLRLAVRGGYGACALYHSPAYYTFAAAVPVCFRNSSETRRPTFASELSLSFVYFFVFFFFYTFFPRLSKLSVNNLKKN